MLTLQAWSLIQSQRLNIRGSFRRMLNRVCWRFCKTFLALLLLLLSNCYFTSKSDNRVCNTVEFCTLNDDIDVNCFDSSFHRAAHESWQHILDRVVVLPLIHPVYEAQLANTNSAKHSAINLQPNGG